MEKKFRNNNQASLILRVVIVGYDSKSEYYISIEPLKSNPTSFDRGTFDTNVKIGQYYAADYVDRFYIR